MTLTELLDAILSKSRGQAEASVTGGQTANPNKDIAGRDISSDAILPGVVQPINPGLQQAYNLWMGSQVGKGVPAYGKPLSPPKNANLTNAFASWSPQGNAGTQGLQALLSQPKQTSPFLTQLMSGGTGGPGQQGLMSIMNRPAPQPRPQQANPFTMGQSNLMNFLLPMLMGQGQKTGVS